MAVEKLEPGLLDRQSHLYALPFYGVGMLQICRKPAHSCLCVSLDFAKDYGPLLADIHCATGTD